MVQSGTIKDYLVLDMRNPGCGTVRMQQSKVAYVSFSEEYRSAVVQLEQQQEIVHLQGDSLLRSFAVQLREFGI